MVGLRVAALVSAVAAMAALQGCAHSDAWSTATVARDDGAPVRAGGLPNRPEHVSVQEGSQVGRAYWVIGDVTVAVNRSPNSGQNPTRDMVREALRVKAAELGADAVISVRYGSIKPSPVSAASLEGTGRAIKYR